MYVKPINPPIFSKDKSIYTIDGFCAFMNWMCNSFFNLEGDKEHGVEIDWTLQDKPKIVVKYV